MRFPMAQNNIQLINNIRRNQAKVNALGIIFALFTFFIFAQELQAQVYKYVDKGMKINGLVAGFVAIGYYLLVLKKKREIQKKNPPRVYGR